TPEAVRLEADARPTQSRRAAGRDVEAGQNTVVLVRRHDVSVEGRHREDLDEEVSGRRVVGETGNLHTDVARVEDVAPHVDVLDESELVAGVERVGRVVVREAVEPRPGGPGPADAVPGDLLRGRVDLEQALIRVSVDEGHARLPDHPGPRVVGAVA